MARYILPIVALLCLLPFVNAGEALLAGVIIALTFGNPYLTLTKQWTSRLLSYSVVGLGAGMNLLVVARVGIQGIGYTIISISAVLFLGYLLGKLLKVERDTSLLVSVGTAICGGSAIAAVSPVLKAKSHEVSVALGIVFMLNALALFIFPPIGHHFSFSESQFGLWCALAIHDTSSVVGAALQYGPHALEVGTTIKLARALWIVPLTLGIGWMRAREANASPSAGAEAAGKAKKPWFILGFLIMAALVTFIPELKEAGHIIETVAKRILVLTLFLIGSGLTRETFKSVGIKPFVQGFALWIIAATSTFMAIYFGVIG